MLFSGKISCSLMKQFNCVTAVMLDWFSCAGVGGSGSGCMLWMTTDSPSSQSISLSLEAGSGMAAAVVGEPDAWRVFAAGCK